ncbi:hypothetical protein VCUG_01104 [Vavraia culicis subsp. floridensis]|uniref:K Homology domain-containing protein n=1 Tax=Vavraia culicis (isolate floridensis) TaxID=948595 RepID=L2GVZ9_VAVCU|nr:uncharacterized protein VCUG_01104 [Vavraia culicis subsp. floridensis]ELA47453.1 hypothetical protein VCUG_01104 [Vavraia culicis subsp. floridensis]
MFSCFLHVLSFNLLIHGPISISLTSPMLKLKKVIPGDSLPDTSQRATQLAAFFTHSSYTLLVTPTALYNPQQNDVAIGKAVGIHPDYIKLDFGHAVKGVLLAQAFLNCTKRNKPKINTGDFLLCRILRVGDVVFASCCEEGLGVLEGGWIFETDALLVKTLFIKKNILNDIGREYKYKIALGLNGMMWIDGKNAMVVKNVRDEIHKRVKSLCGQ